jgi:hypothetical protein
MPVTDIPRWESGTATRPGPNVQMGWENDDTNRIRALGQELVGLQPETSS